MSSRYNKLPSVTIDLEFSFNILADNLCKKANRMLHTLTRVKPYMSCTYFNSQLTAAHKFGCFTVGL